MTNQNIKTRILNPKNRFIVGSSSYDKLISENSCIIDKSLLIKEFIEDGDEVVIITRPRRFGKSLNMSMLKCFFEIPIGDEIKCKNVFDSTP